MTGLLTADQLAQFRGCDPVNACYADCLESAQWVINNPAEDDNADEIADAAEWAASKSWI